MNSLGQTIRTREIVAKRTTHRNMRAQKSGRSQKSICSGRESRKGIFGEMYLPRAMGYGGDNQANYEGPLDNG